MAEWTSFTRTVRAWVVARPIIVAISESLLEALFVFVVSNAFLLVLLFTKLVLTQGATLSFALARDVISSAFTSTEVLVYILALVAPALWIMAYPWRGQRHAFFHFLLFSVQALIVVGSAIIYALAKSGAVPNTYFTGQWALASYIVAVCIWFITLVYEKWLRSVSRQAQPESGKNILKELG
jgi:hypothetical protein